jgi:cell division protein FtsN
MTASPKEGLFRVMVGPYHQTADVADAKVKLKTLGFSEMIVQKQ